MEHAAPRRRPENHPAGRHNSRLRRIAVAVGLALVVLILLGVAVYAAAFLMLAPMMQ